MSCPTTTATTCCEPCSGIQTVQVPGAAGATGAAGADGADGIDSYTTVTAAFTMPAYGATVVAAVGETAWMSVGQTMYVENAGTMEVTAIASSNAVTLENLETAGGAYADNVAPGTVVGAGAKVSPSGIQGQTGGVTYTNSGDIEVDAGALARVAVTQAKGDLIVNIGLTTAPRNTRLAVSSNHRILHCDDTEATGLAWRDVDLTGLNTSLTGDLGVADGGTGGSTAAAARTNLAAAASGANSDITSLASLSTPLSKAQGGTGVNALQCFRAYSAGAQMATSGSATQIHYDTEDWDIGSAYDNGPNYRFSPTVAGKYHLTASVELLNVESAREVEIHIFKNGVVFACSSRFWNGSGATAHVQAQIDVDVLANGAGDYFDARVFHSNPASRNISPDSTRTFFNGHWVY